MPWRVANLDNGLLGGLDNGLLELGVAPKEAQRRRRLIRNRRAYQEENECVVGSLERSCLAEAAGTAFIVTVTGVAVASGVSWMAPVAGLAVGSAVGAFASVSGAHFNPAVTLALVAGDKFPMQHVPAYLASQCAGATLASATVKCLAVTCVAMVPATVPVMPATFAAEAIATALLVFGCFTLADAVEVGRVGKGQSPILVGSLIAALTVCFGHLGVGLNPAMSFAPRILASLSGGGLSALAGAWGYVAGPCAGALLGGSFFAFVMGRGDGLYRAMATLGRSAAYNRATLVDTMLPDRVGLLSQLGLVPAAFAARDDILEDVSRVL